MNHDTPGRRVADRLPRAERAASHVPIHEVKRKLHISPIAGLLLWLSKTDYYVLSLCPTTTRNSLTSLGMMVIFTTLVAFLVALYTAKTTFVSPGAPYAWPIAVGLAVIYAFGILIIDREIVGATSMKALWIRVVFAALIATAVSYPVKLLFFEGRIASEIAQLLEEEHAPKLQRIAEMRRTVENERQEQRQSIRSQIDSLDKDLRVMDEAIEREKNIGHCGPKCQGLLATKEQMEGRKQDLVDGLAALNRPGHLPEPVRLEIERLREEMDSRAANAYDFLFKAEALDRIAAEMGRSYHILSWFIFAFFFLLECVPLGLKLALGRTEYHYYIEARTQINNQKIHSLANLYIRHMQENDEHVLDVPEEVTDIIAAVMEDESTATRRLRNTVTDMTAGGHPAEPVAGTVERRTEEESHGPDDRRGRGHG